MRPVTFGHAAVLASAMLLAACAGAPTPTPAETTASTPPTTTGPTAAPVSKPPLAADLAGGTPLQLGSAGHWTIADGSAFVATDEGTVVALDLATGDTTWQADFSLGDPWDAQPTLGLSAEGTTVIVTRTVEADGAPALDLLLLDAASGATLAEQLVADPAGTWYIDLPPRILAADGMTIVLADNPESGRQTAVVTAALGELVWHVDDEAVAADVDHVVTRGGGWNRADGSRRWQATAPLGPLLAQAPGVVVASEGMVAVWLDPATGQELARSDELGESEPPCAATTDTLVCVASTGVAGYALATGEPLWHSPDQAAGVKTLAGWAYLYRASEDDVVVDARTGQVLATDADLPAIRYSDDTGVLLSTDDGYSWVPFVR
ncbi:MAG: PQQ-binding-like beta-propeller repeat protein [Propionibacteriaceae bacterium]|nr:PQQ-binding-like beta-propeller repeat protein [Propionibacteriaceae bacterium]